MKVFRILAVLVGLGVMGLGTATMVWRQQLQPAVTGETEGTLFEVGTGQPLARIAANLEAEGLIRSALAFEWLARFRGLASELRSGEYRLAASMAPGTILEHLTEGALAARAAS